MCEPSGISPAGRGPAERIRLVRMEVFGNDGVAELAEALGLPVETWSSYEAGETMPGQVLLAFLILMSVSPRWLLTGSGPRYLRPRCEHRSRA